MRIHRRDRGHHPRVGCRRRGRLGFEHHVDRVLWLRLFGFVERVDRNVVVGHSLVGLLVLGRHEQHDIGLQRDRFEQRNDRRCEQR
jgi:hypothetical protein